MEILILFVIQGLSINFDCPRESNWKGACLSTALLKMSTNLVNSELKLYIVISGRNVIKLVDDFLRSSLKALEENLVISLLLLLFLLEGCLLTISVNLRKVTKVI